jgi:hypothetical protein
MAVNLFGVKLLAPARPQGSGSRSRAEQPTINVSHGEAVALYELVRCCGDLWGQGKARRRKAPPSAGPFSKAPEGREGPSARAN